MFHVFAWLIPGNCRVPSQNLDSELNQVIHPCAAKIYTPLFSPLGKHARKKRLIVDDNCPLPHPATIGASSLPQSQSRHIVERLIGTIRRDYLEHLPVWNAGDLERKLLQCKEYYNRDHAHRGLGGAIPNPRPANTNQNIARLDTPMEVLLPRFVSVAGSGLNFNLHSTCHIQDQQEGQMVHPDDPYAKDRR